jgi:hypothetical protein
VIRPVGRLALAWVFLLAVAGVEFVVSGIPMPIADRPVLFVLAIVMIFTIGMVFMRAGKAPIIARGFAVAAMFWLIVLLGLGSMDMLTRHMWLVHGYSPQ